MKIKKYNEEWHPADQEERRRWEKEDQERLKEIRKHNRDDMIMLNLVLSI